MTMSKQVEALEAKRKAAFQRLVKANTAMVVAIGIVAALRVEGVEIPSETTAELKGLLRKTRSCQVAYLRAQADVVESMVRDDTPFDFDAPTPDAWPVDGGEA